MSKRLQFEVGAITALILLLAACGSGNLSQGTSTTPTPISSYFPTGAYVGRNWVMEFTASGAFSLKGPSGNESGSYKAKADQVIITTRNCGKIQGTYLWNYDGKRFLVLKALDDQCLDRLEWITSASWALRP